jgi:hypothetical protein
MKQNRRKKEAQAEVLKAVVATVTAEEGKEDSCLLVRLLFNQLNISGLLEKH